MNTREIAEEYRMTHWAGIMRERKESGQSIRAYCQQTGIHENVYYYWQRKLRAAACEELSEQEAQRPAAPEGWALCPRETVMPTLQTKGKSTATDLLIMEVNGIHITAGSDYPVEQLAQLMVELMKGC